MSISVASDERSVGQLLRELAEDGGDLARAEARLTRLEVGVVARGIARGAAMVAFGAVFAVLGALSLLVGTVLLVGDQWMPADRYWLAALILFVITLIVAAWLTRRGAVLVSPAELAPSETAATLKEDSEWLKRQLTSGGTSN
jgi:uncharacterized membrane protein YqjE